MFDRYNDISKFITDPNKLKIADNDEYCVYISDENDYDIAVDLQVCYGGFDEMKPFIVLTAKHINELDNIVQRFDQQKRVRENGYSLGRLPSSPGVTRFDYSKSMEDEPDPQKRKSKKFHFSLELIYFEKPNFVTFDYWDMNGNSQLFVDFEYKDGKFFLREFGAFANIPDDWDKGIDIEIRKLQPLRIPGGWTVNFNDFMDIDPSEISDKKVSNEKEWLLYFSEDLLYISTEITRKRNKQTETQSLGIDLGWYPEGDPNGSFKLQAILNDNWENPLLSFSSRSKDEITEMLEQWLFREFMPRYFIDEQSFRWNHICEYSTR